MQNKLDVHVPDDEGEASRKALLLNVSFSLGVGMLICVISVFSGVTAGDLLSSMIIWPVLGSLYSAGFHEGCSLATKLGRCCVTAVCVAVPFMVAYLIARAS